MRKIGLLLVLAALAFSSKAIDFPTDWEIAKTAWSDIIVAPAGYTRNTATAVDFGEYLDLGSIDFFDTWGSIPETQEYPMKNVVLMDDAPAKAIDGTGSFKVGFDDEGIIVFVYFIDDEAATKNEKWEIAYSPYHKLGENGRNFTNVEGEDRSGVLYTRYWELGASKLTMMSTGVDGIMQISGSAKTAKDVSKDLVSKFSIEFYNYSDNFNPEEIRWAAKIPYYALDDSYYGTEFDKTAWAAACDGEGISFDVKIKDVDSGMEKGSRDYWWNANVNHGFWSTDWAGYLKQGGPISIDDAVAAASNISIKGDRITLAEAGTIQIFSAAGMLIASVSNETELSTSGLAAGVYVAVAGSESVTFVK